MNEKTLAKRYVLAFKQSLTSAEMAPALSLLGSAVQFLLDNTKWLSVLKNPMFTADQKQSLIQRLLTGSPQAELVGRFFTVIIKKNRTGIISQLPKEIDAQICQIEGKIRAEFSFAHPLPDQIIDQFILNFEGKTNTAVKPVSVVNSDLIGGFQVKYDNKLLDGSISSQLNRLKGNLEV